MTQPAASSSSAAAAIGLPVTIDLLAAEMVALYAGAESQMLADLARIADGSTSTMLGAMRREAQRIATALRLRSWPLAYQIADMAAQRGAASAAAELKHLIQTSPRVAQLLLRAPSGTAAAAQIGIDLATRLDSTLPGFLRLADDAYRAATVSGALTAVADTGTPAIAQQVAWRKLTERGITGFVDSSGRKWNLASYVEMATRTAVQRAYNAAHLDRMTAVGIEHFTVTDDGHPCPLCKPWQGRVLTRNGARPTIAEATAAGLFHPNCRHTLVAYFPFITKLPAPTPWTPADQARYDATQQLRALERDVRAHKRAAIGARTQIDARRANARIRATQARIRAHVERHGLVRRSRREHLDLGSGGVGPPKPPTPRSGGGGGEPPDDEWRRRQAALGIETHGEILTPAEIQFVERFHALGHRVEWISQDPNRKPTNDFIWLSNGRLITELKSNLAKHSTIRGSIERSVRKAEAQGVTKNNFVVDLGEQVFTPDLATDLAGYNAGRRKYRIARLWVMSRGVLTEIHLT